MQFTRQPTVDQRIERCKRLMSFYRNVPAAAVEAFVVAQHRIEDERKRKVDEQISQN